MIPPGSTQKSAASVTLGNLTQTYNGNALLPTATTSPAGLAVTWTNAPQTKPNSYAVSATINDANYQGGASGTFTISKAPASVMLSNLVQTYSGNPLTPLATTNPAGLAVVWTNAPQSQAGTYAVTATVNDPNYQGSASGVFKIAGSTNTVIPPTVSITSPVSGLVEGGTLVIQALATPGTFPIAHVDFLINGSVKCSDTTAPYSCSWNVPGAAGKTYQLQSKAYDSAGSVANSTVVNLTSSR